MATRSGVHPITRRRPTAGTGCTHVTKKNRGNAPDRLVPRRYDSVTRRHVEFKEAPDGPGLRDARTRRAQSKARPVDPSALR